MPEASDEYGDSYNKKILPNRFALPGDDNFEGDLVEENIRDLSADSENEDGDIEHGIRREGTGEWAVNKCLFGSTSESNSDGGDDESGRD